MQGLLEQVCSMRFVPRFIMITPVESATKKNKRKKIDNGQVLRTVTDKRQTRSLVREGAQQRQHSEIQTELLSGRNVTSDLRP
jgi:hypothetical protein